MRCPLYSIFKTSIGHFVTVSTLSHNVVVG
jgi:hypothetical protein